MNIKRCIIAIYLIAIAIYCGHVRWNPIDNEAFYVIYPPSTPYGGLLISETGVVPWYLFLFIFFLPSLFFLNEIRGHLKILSLPLLLFTAAIFLSSLWSIDAVNSLIQASIFLVIIEISLISALLLGAQRSILIVTYLGIVICTVSGFLAVIGDEHALMSGYHTGSWRGLFNHKNVFAPYLISTVVPLVFYGPELRIPRLMNAFLVMVLLFLIFTTKSSTALILISAIMAVGALTFNKHQRKLSKVGSYIIILSAFVVTLAGLYEFREGILGLFGKDLSLSNRTLIWSAAFDYTFTSPVGSGYGTSGGPDLVQYVRTYVGWNSAMSVHSAYLNLALEIGWIACFIFSIWLLSPTLLILKSNILRSERLLILFSLLAFGGGLTEVTSAPYPSLPFLIFLILYFDYRKRRLVSDAKQGSNQFDMLAGAV